MRHESDRIGRQEHQPLGEAPAGSRGNAPRARVVSFLMARMRDWFAPRQCLFAAAQDSDGGSHGMTEVWVITILISLLALLTIVGIVTNASNWHHEEKRYRRRGQLPNR